MIEVESDHLERLAPMHVDRAVVDGRERTGFVDRADETFRTMVDDLDLARGAAP